MALSTTNRKVQYTLADPIPSTFPITFQAWNSSEIRVLLTDAQGTTQELVLGSDFSITDSDGQPDATDLHGEQSTLVRIGSWQVGTLTIYREVEKSQPTDLVSGGKISAEVVEKMFDKLTAMIQELDEGLLRSGQSSIVGDGDIVVSEYMRTLLDELNASSARNVLGVTGSWLIDMIATLGRVALAIDATHLGGELPAFYRNAGNMNAGTLPQERLPEIPLANIPAELTGKNAASASVAASCSGNAATATVAAACSGNAATATVAANATNANAVGGASLSTITDARTKYKGFINGSVSKNSVYQALTSLIPNINEVIQISGGVTRGAGDVMIAARAVRIDANTISIQGISTGTYMECAVSFANGDSSSNYVALSW